MPLCHLFTNRQDSELKDGIEERIAKVLAEALHKPLERMVIIIVPGVRIYRRNTTDPACTFNINAIGSFDEERNPSYSPAIFKILMEELNLPKERCCVTFQDLKPHMLGI